MSDPIAIDDSAFPKQSCPHCCVFLDLLYAGDNGDNSDSRYYRCSSCGLLFEWRETQCDDEWCYGWFHGNIDEDREGVQRCDTCRLFPDDSIAAKAHDLVCRCGAGDGIPIQRCHQCGFPRTPGSVLEDEQRVFCSDDCRWAFRNS